MAHTSLIFISLIFAQASNADVIHEVFPQEVCTYDTWEDGLPGLAPNGDRFVDVKTLIVPQNGTIYAVLRADNGSICYASFDGTSWRLVSDEEIDRAAPDFRDYMRLTSGSMMLPDGERVVAISNLSASSKGVLAASAKKLYTNRGVNNLHAIFEASEKILSVAAGARWGGGSRNGKWALSSRKRTKSIRKGLSRR